MIKTLCTYSSVYLQINSRQVKKFILVTQRTNFTKSISFSLFHLYFHKIILFSIQHGSLKFFFILFVIIKNIIEDNNDDMMRIYRQLISER